MGLVELKNLKKQYGTSQILKGIDLKMKEGEFLVLVGPSGCGKSTCLKMIAGLEYPTSGEIFIDGRKVNNVDPKDRDVAMVFQSYALYPHKSVYENMAFGLRIRKLPNEEIEERIQRAAKILQITDLLKRRPRQLSGGQRQRVALGRVIVREPKIFLFDEPLSNLDAKLREDMRVEIRKLHRLLKSSTIYVTHDRAEAMTLGQRIAVMDKGQIIQIGSPREIYTHPKNMFVADFMSLSDVNFISGEVRKEGPTKFFVFADQKVDISAHPVADHLPINQPVIVGLRPEDILGLSKDDRPVEQNFVSCVLDFVENFGSDFLVHLKVNDLLLRARVSSEYWGSIDEDDLINVFINIPKLYFFDAETKETIGPNHYEDER